MKVYHRNRWPAIRLSGMAVATAKTPTGRETPNRGVWLRAELGLVER